MGYGLQTRLRPGSASRAPQVRLGKCPFLQRGAYCHQMGRSRREEIRSIDRAAESEEERSPASRGKTPQLEEEDGPRSRGLTRPEVASGLRCCARFQKNDAA